MTNVERRDARWDALWYMGFGVVALLVGLTDSAPLARHWGLIASGTYGIGAAVSLGLVRTTAQRWALIAVVFVGAVALPLGLEVWWRAENGLGTHAKSETVVTEESARAFLDGENPYATVYSDGPLSKFPPGVDSHVPYLPGNTVFGIVRPLLEMSSTENPDRYSAAGDARFPFAAVFLGATAAALTLSRAPSGERLRACMVVVVSPLGARYVVGGGNDLPVIGLMLLALTLLDRRRPGGSGVAAGLAAAVKFTAWPLVPFLVAASRDRTGRPARMKPAVIVGVIVAGTVIPFLLWDAAAMIEDVVRYPLGLTPGGTPATSPTIGGVLAAWFPAAREAIAIAAGVMVAGLVVWLLVRRTPRTAREAARATAFVLLASTALATAGRFGYLVYAIDLWVWSAWILAADETESDTVSSG